MRAMPEPDNILDVDFDSQMRGLFQQAEQAIEKRSADEAKQADSAPRESAITGDLHPMLNTLATVSKSTEENAALLAKIEKATTADDAARQSLTKIVADLRALLEMKNGVSHSMFSALHDELKGYKDGFLLQSLHRPIIRDLVSLYDDMAEVHRQLSAAIVAATHHEETSADVQAFVDQIRKLEMNVGHNVEFIVEILARLDVVPLPPTEGKLDKCNQRAVAVETTDNPDDDTLVVRSIRHGFLWNDRVLRPEEVVIKKWKGNLRPPADPQPSADTAPQII